MGIVVALKEKTLRWRVWHKLFKCPTFWQLKSFFHCPQCGKGMRCYWDGNDVTGHGIDYCNPCAKALETP